MSIRTSCRPYSPFHVNLISNLRPAMLAAAIVACSATGALANIVVNSGFEDPPIASSFSRLGAGQTVGSGWIVGSGEVDIVRNTRWLPRSGSQSLDLDGNVGVAGSVYQDLATEPGQIYSLDFWMAGNLENSPVMKRMEVFWEGASVGVFEYTNSSGNPAAPTWDFHQVGNLVASGTTTRLSFVSRTGSGYGPALDDVSVVLVPTPSAAALLGLGGLLAARRRR